jgi:hypothetical protein
MLLRTSIILATSAILALAAPSQTLAVVNNIAITTADANSFLSKAAPGMSFDKLDPKMKRQVVDQLVNQRLIKGQVAKSGIQNTPQFKLAYAQLRDDLAVEMWMKQQMSEISISDKEAQAFYDANKEQMKEKGKPVSYEQSKGQIMQFLKMEKFKGQMTKMTESLRAGSKVEVKL